MDKVTIFKRIAAEGVDALENAEFEREYLALKPTLSEEEKRLLSAFAEIGVDAIDDPKNESIWLTIKGEKTALPTMQEIEQPNEDLPFSEMLYPRLTAEYEKGSELGERAKGLAGDVLTLPGRSASALADLGAGLVSGANMGDVGYQMKADFNRTNRPTDVNRFDDDQGNFIAEALRTAAADPSTNLDLILTAALPATALKKIGATARALPRVARALANSPKLLKAVSAVEGASTASPALMAAGRATAEGLASGAVGSAIEGDGRNIVAPALVGGAVGGGLAKLGARGAQKASEEVERFMSGVGRKGSNLTVDQAEEVAREMLEKGVFDAPTAGRIKEAVKPMVDNIGQEIGAIRANGVARGTPEFVEAENKAFTHFYNVLEGDQTLLNEYNILPSQIPEIQKYIKNHLKDFDPVTQGLEKSFDKISKSALDELARMGDGGNTMKKAAMEIMQQRATKAENMLYPESLGKLKYDYFKGKALLEGIEEKANQFNAVNARERTKLQALTNAPQKTRLQEAQQAFTGGQKLASGTARASVLPSLVRTPVREAMSDRKDSFGRPIPQSEIWRYPKLTTLRAE